MVLAHLRSHNPKTQTRRLINPQPVYTKHSIAPQETRGDPPKHPAPYFDAYCGQPKTKINPRGMSADWCWWDEYNRQGDGIRCPYGVPGDQIWGKETFTTDGNLSNRNVAEPNRIRCHGTYTADNTPFVALLTEDESSKFHQWREQSGTKPSIFMFRSLSRIQRTITEVRAQRLQDITEQDAMAEGIEEMYSGAWKNYQFKTAHPRKAVPITDIEHRIHSFRSIAGGSQSKPSECSGPIQSYRSLWNSLNGTPQAVTEKDENGKPRITHYVCHPWALEDLATYRGGCLLRQIQQAPAYGYQVTEDNGTYILSRTNGIGPSLHIHTNPWVWALTYR